MGVFMRDGERDRPADDAAGGHRGRDGDDHRAARRRRRVPARDGAASRRIRGARRAPRPARRLDGLPRAHRAAPRARRDRGSASSRTGSIRGPTAGRRSSVRRRVCDVCGEPCKRSDVAGLDGFAYVGDGFSDRCVAQAARRVFARDGLATYLAGKGVAFERFDDFYDVAGALDGGAVVPPRRSRGRKT